MNENEDLSSSSESLLPEDVIAILNKGMTESFVYDSLGLYSKNINDSMMPELCEWVIKLGDKMKILNLTSNQITSVGASLLFDKLKMNSSTLKVINLCSNKQIDDKCMKSLGEYIKSNKYIEIILMDRARISDTGIEMFAPYIDNNIAFKGLYLKYNTGITDKSIPLLMKMIESSCIEDLDVDYTPITQKNIIYALLACNIVKYGSTRLNLRFREINDDDLIKICDAMKKYGINKLNEMNLTRNKITSKGASVLFDTLKECNSFVSNLDLSANQLDDECMKQLGEYFQDNEHVESLKLGGNKITDKGVEILSEYLIGNTTLKGLNLNGNEGITDASVLRLIKMINKSCITSMDLGYTLISKEKKQEIEKALLISIDQREVPIKSNTKSAAKIQSSSTSAST